MIQLAIGTKTRVIELIKNCSLGMNGLDAKTILKVLPLGPYDALIDMEFLEAHSVILNFLTKYLTV